jgi:hypothetical protein
MRKVCVLSLLLVLLVADRAEAATITLLSQSYSIGGNICKGFPLIPPCASVPTQSSSSPPLSGSASIPDGSVYVSTNGGTDLSSGFLDSAAGYLPVPSLLDGGAGATAIMDFRVNETAEIVLNCTITDTFGGGSVGLRDLTTDFLFLCFTGFGGSITKSGSFLLNTTDTYELTARSAVNAPDNAHAHVNFQVPDPPTFCLLGVALISLSFVCNRLRKEKRAVRPPGRLHYGSRHDSITDFLSLDNSDMKEIRPPYDNGAPPVSELKYLKSSQGTTRLDGSPPARNPAYLISGIGVRPPAQLRNNT